MKKIFSLSRLLLLLIIILSFAGNVQARTQLSDSLKAEMRKISTAMYDSGNLHYLDVDALCDGLIQPGEDYSISYDANKVLLVDENPVPYFVHQQYQDKLRLFLQANPLTSFSVKADSLSIDKIFDPHSFFRTNRNTKTVKIPDAVFDDKDVSKLISTLNADELIDPAVGYHVILSSEGFFIDDKKMDNQLMQTYLHILASVDKTIADGNIPYLEVRHKPDSDKK